MTADLGAQWRPIDAEAMSAPLVDLWVRYRKTGREWRVTDCRLSGGPLAHPNWIDPDGRWVAGKHYIDEDGDQCFDPDCRDEDSVIIVAWMPPPGPPIPTTPPDPATGPDGDET